MSCRLCRSQHITPLVDFGPQPICNRFPASASEPEARFPLAVCQCRSCGLVQLVDVAPAAELQPRVDWITYKEAEGHLDRLVAETIAVAKPRQDARIVGVSFKDASTVERFQKAGFQNVIHLDPAADLGITAAGAGIETIQDRLTPDRARALLDKYGPADLVIARHILEHAHDLRRFVDAVRALLKPQGFAVFEVPDFTIAMEHFDYSTIWEEHAVYFTPATFAGSFANLSFDVLRSLNYPYPLENSLVAIVRPSNLSDTTVGPIHRVDPELRGGRAYAESFPRIRERLNGFLAAEQAKGPIAIFGAGHLACKFVNLLGLGSHIAFVADDHPHKKGRVMPGSHLPIRASAALMQEGVRLCLLSLNPESEEKVLKNNQSFVEKGGIFASIFPASPRRLVF
jgi:hypothetical protein